MVGMLDYYLDQVDTMEKSPAEHQGSVELDASFLGLGVRTEQNGRRRPGARLDLRRSPNG